MWILRTGKETGERRKTSGEKTKRYTNQPVSSFGGYVKVEKGAPGVAENAREAYLLIFLEIILTSLENDKLLADLVQCLRHISVIHPQLIQPEGNHSSRLLCLVLFVKGYLRGTQLLNECLYRLAETAGHYSTGDPQSSINPPTLSLNSALGQCGD